MLKNERAALPLRAGARVHLCGSRADDLGVQCGGWSVGWRGQRGTFTTGTTIRAGARAGAGRRAPRLFDRRGRGPARADVVVAVVGEDPYAEGSGDRAKLELPADDRALIAAAKARPESRWSWCC